MKWAGTDFLEEFFVLLDEFPRCAGTDQGYGCVAVPGFLVFPEVQIGVDGRIIDVLKSHPVAIGFIADEVELAKIVEDFKFDAGSTGFNDQDIKPLRHLEHFMLRFHLIATGAEELPGLEFEKGIKSDCNSGGQFR